jgi:hypothetical protein
MDIKRIQTQMQVKHFSKRKKGRVVVPAETLLVVGSLSGNTTSQGVRVGASARWRCWNEGAGLLELAPWRRNTLGLAEGLGLALGGVGTGTRRG